MSEIDGELWKEIMIALGLIQEGLEAAKEDRSCPHPAGGDCERCEKIALAQGVAQRTQNKIRFL